MAHSAGKGRAMDTYTIASGTEIYSQSIHQTDVATDDANSDGSRITNGTNRSISAGISTYGTIVLWIETNGDPVMLYEAGDDPAAALAACHDMGDAPDDAATRCADGLRRIRDAIQHLRSDVYNTDAAAEDLDWYDGWCDDVKSMIDDADNQDWAD